ncbi:hypothetical protein L208DRAFT_1298367 [Tricholoma matsutake]|nr:hypothetical protein L208DRAFT_1298367 [Tricholoma matsutake 945]
MSWSPWSRPSLIHYTVELPHSFSHVFGLSVQLCCLIFFLTLSLLFGTIVLPTSAQSELSVCALNSNGLMSPVKLAFIGPFLMKLAPHFFAHLETKTHSNAASNLLISNYEIFEEKAVPLAKWGIILGIRRDLQIPLKGHVICVDVIVPSLSSTSSSSIYHVFLVYAPCDPGADDLSHNFWPCLMDVVQGLKMSWSLFGDFNTTVSASEHASDNALTWCTFDKFLRRTCGTDLWQQCPDHNQFIDWTCHGWHLTDGGNIIDHVVVLSCNLLDSKISTDPAWIPGSDHRAVKAKIVLKSTNC